MALTFCGGSVWAFLHNGQLKKVLTSLVYMCHCGNKSLHKPSCVLFFTFSYQVTPKYSQKLLWSKHLIDVITSKQDEKKKKNSCQGLLFGKNIDFLRTRDRWQKNLVNPMLVTSGDWFSRTCNRIISPSNTEFYRKVVFTFSHYFLYRCFHFSHGWCQLEGRCSTSRSCSL